MTKEPDSVVIGDKFQIVEEGQILQHQDYIYVPKCSEFIPVPLEKIGTAVLKGVIVKRLKPRDSNSF